MYVALILTFLCFANGRIIDRKHAEIVKPKILREDILKENICSPYQLAIDYDTATLFFSYTISGYHQDDVFKSAYIDLKTGKFGNISGIAGGFAQALDHENHVLYLGGRDGLYLYDSGNKTAQHIEGTDHNIWQMFYKGGLYYTTYPEEQVYVFKEGVATPVPELKNTHALLVGISNDGSIFFANSSGLYHSKRSRVYNLGEYNINGMTSDIDGCLYFSTPEGIYYIDENRKIITQLTHRDNIYGVAVDADQSIIYATGNKILRLQPIHGDTMASQFNFYSTKYGVIPQMNY